MVTPEPPPSAFGSSFNHGGGVGLDDGSEPNSAKGPVVTGKVLPPDTAVRPPTTEKQRFRRNKGEAQRRNSELERVKDGMKVGLELIPITLRITTTLHSGFGPGIIE